MDRLLDVLGVVTPLQQARHSLAYWGKVLFERVFELPRNLAPHNLVYNSHCLLYSLTRYLARACNPMGRAGAGSWSHGSPLGSHG